MSFKKSLSMCTLSVLTLAFAGVAHGWGVGGAIRSPYKTVFNDGDLHCDLDDPLSTANIDAKARPPYFKFDGNVICWEVVHNGVPEKDRVSAKVLFTLIQQRMDKGLEVMECSRSAAHCADGGAPPTGDIQKRTTWVFRIEHGRNENLLWRLIPADQNAVKEFCKDQNDHPIAAPYCAANFGLDEHEKATSTDGIPDGGGDGEKANDYPARDVSGDGIDDLRMGEIFKFTTTTTTAGQEKMGDFFWGPCHSGQYGKFTFPGCEFRDGASKKETISKGKGKPKHVPLK